MIEYLPELIKSGVTSLKIDSKFRTIEYMTKVVDIYKKTIESNDYRFNKSEVKELLNTDNRNYTTAFYLDKEELEDK